jgi:hypothetical protein
MATPAQLYWHPERRESTVIASSAVVFINVARVGPYPPGALMDSPDHDLPWSLQDGEYIVRIQFTAMGYPAQFLNATFRVYSTGGPFTQTAEWLELCVETLSLQYLPEEADVRESRLHEARHTAATVLLLLEVPLRTVMSIMGWSSVEMAARYQHITDTIRQKVAGQVDQVIWQTTSSPDETGLVGVRGEALAVILPIVDSRLAHSDVEALTDLEEVILRAALAGGATDGPGAVPDGD